MDDAAADHRRLASLIVEALEIGTRKSDRFAGEFCAVFGIDLVALDESQPDYSDQHRDATRATVLDSLVGRSGTAEVLVEAFARLGGSVIGMVDEIYRTLAAHALTVGQPAESFRLRADGTNLDITVSAAFLERVRKLVQRTFRVERGYLDPKLLSDLVLLDGGASYGRYPPETKNGRRLLHQVMILRPYRDRLAARVHDSLGFAEAVRRCDDALQAAERLVGHLEHLLVGAGAAMLAADDVPLSDDGDALSGLVQERETLREFGLFGGRANSILFTDLDADVFIGTRVATGDPLEPTSPEPELRSDLVNRWGDSLSQLGAYVAVVRSGLTLREENWLRDVREALDASTPDLAIQWLDGVEAATDEARAWIDDTLWRPTGTAQVNVAVEEIEELLNLPLWRQRHLLFEIWLLCHTIATCERIGWHSELHGIVDHTWTLPQRASVEPVASLDKDGAGLWVWREPDRELTPDVSVSTADLACRDLVVVEAKDQFRMQAGLGGDRSEPARDDTALGVATRYAAKLGALVTWVCNHSTFRGEPTDPRRNEGTAWHQVRLAEDFGPGHVPPPFAESLRAALTLPLINQAADGASELIVVLDTTASMRAAGDDVIHLLEHLNPNLFSKYSAILYGDHDDEYIVRPVAAHPSPAALAAAIAREPTTAGQDAPEALEDAMHHAAWLASGDDQLFVVATDAPPHPPTACPDAFDIGLEVANVLNTGATILVITDWYVGEPSEWRPFETHPKFAFVRMADLTDRLQSAMLRSSQPPRLLTPGKAAN